MLLPTMDWTPHTGTMCKHCHPNPAQALLNYRHDGSDFGDIGDMRKRMGEDAEKYSDEDLARVRQLLFVFADAAYDWWQQRSETRPLENPSHNGGEAASPPSQP